MLKSFIPVFYLGPCLLISAYAVDQTPISDGNSMEIPLKGQPTTDSNSLRAVLSECNDWETFNKRNGLYVDKTKTILKLINSGRLYIFMVRPRKFGKTFLVDTLEKIYEGRKDLLKNTAIAKSGYKWEKYPVLRFDFGLISGFNETGQFFENVLSRKLLAFANEHEVIRNIHREADIRTQLADLIDWVEDKWKKTVVILVDDYDKPILASRGNQAIQRDIVRILKEFYEALKAQKAKLKFVFVTGANMHPLTYINTAFNVFQDISFDPDFASLLGFTYKEIEENFSDHIKELAEKRRSHGHLRTTMKEILREINDTYGDGYNFANYNEPFRVLHPYSALKYFEKMQLEGPPTCFWMETCTFEDFIETIKEFSNVEISLKGYDINKHLLTRPDCSPVNLLHNHGYLTIKDYDPSRGFYFLDFPNAEVRYACMKYLLEYVIQDRSVKNKVLVTAEKGNEYLEARNIEEYVHTVNSLFNLVSNYSQPINNTQALVLPPETAEISEYVHQCEDFYSSYLMFFLIVGGLNLKVVSELRLEGGRRVDIYVSSLHTEFIIECTFGAPDALEGLEKALEYVPTFANRSSEKEILALSFNFDKKMKNIKHWDASLFTSTGIPIRTGHCESLVENEK